MESRFALVVPVPEESTPVEKSPWEKAFEESAQPQTIRVVTTILREALQRVCTPTPPLAFPKFHSQNLGLLCPQTSS